MKAEWLRNARPGSGTLGRRMKLRALSVVGSLVSFETRSGWYCHGRAHDGAVASFSTADLETGDAVGVRSLVPEQGPVRIGSAANRGRVDLWGRHGTGDAERGVPDVENRFANTAHAEVCQLGAAPLRPAVCRAVGHGER